MATRVGADLRAARERLGWSLPDTSAFLRIRLPFLNALEEGRVGELPGPAYVVGFVRTYAVALGIDPEEMVRRYREETGEPSPRAKLDFPTPLPRRGVPAGAVVMLGVLLAAGAYIGWYRSSDQSFVAVAVQQVPARLAPLALPIVPPPPAHVAAAAPATSIAQAYTPPTVPPSAAEAGVPPPGSLSPIEPAPIAAVAGNAAAPNHIVLGATADAWIQVKDGAGKIVLSKLMHDGDRWDVPDAPPGAAPFVLTTGNAGGTTLTVGGSAVGSLGSSGAVKRDLPLDPASLAAASAQAASH